MNAVEIIALIGKGLVLIKALIEAGKDAMPAIQALMKTFGKGDRTKVTDEELAECEATLDALLDEFEAPLPPEVSNA